jgi:hypothetical protein
MLFIYFQNLKTFCKLVLTICWSFSPIQSITVTMNKQNFNLIGPAGHNSNSVVRWILKCRKSVYRAGTYNISKIPQFTFDLRRIHALGNVNFVYRTL